MNVTDRYGKIIGKLHKGDRVQKVRREGDRTAIIFPPTQFLAKEDMMGQLSRELSDKLVPRVGTDIRADLYFYAPPIPPDPDDPYLPPTPPTPPVDEQDGVVEPKKRGVLPLAIGAIAVFALLIALSKMGGKK